MGLASWWACVGRDVSTGHDGSPALWFKRCSRDLLTHRLVLPACGCTILMVSVALQMIAFPFASRPCGATTSSWTKSPLSVSTGNIYFEISCIHAVQSAQLRRTKMDGIERMLIEVYVSDVNPSSEQSIL